MALHVELVATFHGHRSSIYALCEAQDGVFFSAGGDGLVVAWQVHNSQQARLLAKVQNPVFSIYLDAAQELLVVAENHEGLHWIDLRQKKEKASLRLSPKRLFDIQRLDTSHLLVAGEEGVLYVVNEQRRYCVERLQLSTMRLRSIAVHPSRNLVVVGGSEGVIFVLDKQLSLLHSFPAHKQSIFNLRFHPQLPYLLSGGRDACLNVWHLDQQFALQKTIPAHYYTLNSISFHEHGGDFVTGSMDKSIKWWDGETFRLLKVIDRQRYDGHQSSVNTLLWMQYQHLILSGSDDRSLKAWRIATQSGA